MVRGLLFSLLVVFTLTAFTQDVQHYYTLAKEAYQQKDFQSYYSNLREANRLHPYHQVILYRLGVAAALTQHPEEAITWLRKALLIDASFQLEGNPDLAAITSTKGFNDLVLLQKEISKPVIHSDTAFVLKDRTLHAEGIEYDVARKTFYIGSIHQRKVIKINSRGEISDFCAPAQEGMTSVFGLKADPERNALWVCSSPMQEMTGYDSTYHSAVFKFNLTTKKLLNTFQTGPSQPDGVFGDLILNKKGEVFISDSKNNIIYKVNEQSKELDTFYTSTEFWNIQGMAFSADNTYLFISDYIKGIFRLKLSNKELIQIANITDTSLKGVDGLYFYKKNLITIQNGVTPARVTTYLLNKEMNEAVYHEIIDRAHPAFNEPTLGVLVKDFFYYIANSQWSGYKNGKQKPADQLQDIVILKAKLK